MAGVGNVSYHNYLHGGIVVPEDTKRDEEPQKEEESSPVKKEEAGVGGIPGCKRIVKADCSIGDLLQEGRKS